MQYAYKNHVKQASGTLKTRKKYTYYTKFKILHNTYCIIHKIVVICLQAQKLVNSF